MIRTARLRLLAYITAVIAVVLLATGSMVYVLLTRQLDEALDDRLRAIALPFPLAQGQTQPPPEERVPEGVFFVRGLGPRGLSRSAAAPEDLPDVPGLNAARATGSDIRTIEVNGERYRLLTTVLPVVRPSRFRLGGGNGGLGNGSGDEGGQPGQQAQPGQELVAFQQVGISMAERDRQQWVIRLALAGGGGLGFALTGLGAFFLTGRALAPVETSMVRQRRFVSDASHELRTPLALLRLELERESGLESERRRPLLREVDRLGRMVDDLLVLARSDEGAMPLDREPVPVADLLRTAADEARRLAPEAHVHVEANGDLWVNADADRLHQVLLVLVDNAARVTPAGAALELRARRERGSVELEVADGGPGVPREHAAQIFERFYRVDRARARAQGGAGLGLPIASEIVRAHGGELCLANPGEPHARFVVRLPALDFDTSTVTETVLEQEPATE